MVRCSACKNDFELFPVCFTISSSSGSICLRPSGPQAEPQKHGINRICSIGRTDLLCPLLLAGKPCFDGEIKESWGPGAITPPRILSPTASKVVAVPTSMTNLKFTSFVSSQRIGDAILFNFTGVGIGMENHRKSCH